MASLVIFDFDGTLFDTHQSISHSIKLTFDALSPTQSPPESEVQRYISSGTGLSDTFRALTASVGVAFDKDTEAEWTAKYREVYASDGQPLIRPFPGAKELLQHLAQRKVPMAIVSNKGVAAVVTALARSGLADYVPRELIVGDSTPGATRKPDPSSYTAVLLPAVTQMYGVSGLDAGKVLEVGDTVADVQFARNIGAKSCWCRFGYGDAKACAELEPDYVVDTLEQVISICDAL
ncbi:hypothetical protein LMH87_009776 [Akanthomyces muscarius]|uniref:Phosphoglycolate phosphatase n=1 Tax=Akanthomyces muscarius TaxID=2231603 RepID=A0A9W8UMK2_AKAMU|nr:hypothetical protein LMH87_009776 [Akanthomyces muscarius]KAJ4153281.1 hypothetical protein LMH87_009776 [Akanthomyces muscarius]